MKLFLHVKVGMAMALISAIILLQSCSKDDASPEPRFEIQFSNETVSFSKVDSITASFSRVGQAPNFTRKLTKGIGSNTYFLSEGDLKEGAWDATINVYTTEDQGSHRKYELKRQYADLTVATKAPVVKAGDPWTPYIVLTNIPNNVTFIIPERQDQSTFELTTGNAWNYLYIERSSYGKDLKLVQSKDWEVKAEVKGRINNSTAFFDYTENLKTKSWNSTEILINLKKTGTGEECFLYCTYVNRYQL